MIIKDKCPECGSRRIGEGVFSGYANLTVKGRFFSSSKVLAKVCSNCGLVLELRVADPGKFIPKE